MTGDCARADFVQKLLRRSGLRLLLLLLLAAAGAWSLVELASKVLEGETRALDERILLAMRAPGRPDDPIGPRWLEELARDVTALGGWPVLLFVCFGAVGYLALNGKGKLAWMLLATVIGGMLLSLALKAGFDRPRPDLVPHGAYVSTRSFPSGHAMQASITYLTLGALLARVQRRRAVRLFLMSLAVLVTSLVGASRVFLGVHWPSDVLAGWTAGITWAILCWLVAERLQILGNVEG